jgi:galactokinase
MAFVLAWEALSGFQLDDLVRARLGQQVENKYLGVGSGIMDQFASLRGRADHLILLDCRSLEGELIPLPPGTAVLVADSGVRRALTQINYNSRPAECREATAILRQYLPDISTLRDVTPEALARHAHHLPDVLRRRARHVVGECARVLAGAAALRQGDLAMFGRLMRQSQISSGVNYENSIPELDLLAATAWQTPGCYGARFSGAGFGGCMQILAERPAVPAIQQALAEAFEKEFDRAPPMFTCTIADGASVTPC